MKREDFENLIENERLGQSALVGINSQSKAGVWVQLRFVLASLFELFFAQLERWRTEVEGLVATRPWATVGWYIERAKAFQLGDMLELRPDATYAYPQKNPAKQVIKQAAIDVVDRELRLKVATEKDGSLAKVPDEVMLSFRPYFEQIKRPGTLVRYINKEADLLRLSLRVWFDGELVEAHVRTQLTEAVHFYLKGIVFNGVFSVTGLIDTLQRIPGISEVQWLDGTARSAEQDFENATPITARYRAVSGYFAIERIEDVEQLLIELIRET